MATKYRAFCKSCDFRGNEYLNPVTAKKQRSKHQMDTDYQHNVGIEITEEVKTIIDSNDIERPTSDAEMRKLFKIK